MVYECIKRGLLLGEIEIGPIDEQGFFVGRLLAQRRRDISQGLRIAQLQSQQTRLALYGPIGINADLDFPDQYQQRTRPRGGLEGER